jgi:hypothetical protein
MLDKMIDFGTTFDWLTPIWTFYQDWRNRPSVGYSVRAGDGWSAYAIRDLLAAKGVNLWGLAIVDGAILFRLRRGQAEYAQYWLRREGVPYSGGIVRKGARNA